MVKGVNHNDLTTLFIDRRRLTHADHPLREALATPDFLHLTPEIAIARSDFDALQSWDRQRARTLAFGLAADRAILVSRSAAIVHGLWTPGQSSLVELSYLHRGAPSKKQCPPQVTYRRSWLNEDEVTVVAGFRVTTLPRTLRDVTRYHGLLAGVIAIDCARARDPQLRLDKVSGGRFSGVDDVRQAVALSTGLAESPLESEACVLLRTDPVIGQHSIVQQQEIRINGRVFRLDVLIDGWLNIELDGDSKYDGHTYGRKTDAVMRLERQREKLIQNAGLRVLRYNYPGMRNNMISEVRAALAAPGKRPLIRGVENSF